LVAAGPEGPAVTVLQVERVPGGRNGRRPCVIQCHPNRVQGPVILSGQAHHVPAGSSLAQPRTP